MGKVVLKLGDDISTDIIYPGRFMATVLPTETPQFAFADDIGFNVKLKANEVPTGSVVVANQNFGCGSSREQAASCLKGWELTIVAKHFARIFLQNAINLGLNVVICPDVEADESDELEELDEDEPWIQLFPMNPGMDKFIYSDEDEIVFWSIGTESPADMEINSFSAEKEDSGYHDEFGCKVIRINFSPTGWKSWFWDGDYFFRLDDARVMGYRGDGAPGKPSSKTTLIIEE